MPDARNVQRRPSNVDAVLPTLAPPTLRARFLPCGCGCGRAPHLCVGKRGAAAAPRVVALLRSARFKGARVRAPAGRSAAPAVLLTGSGRLLLFPHAVLKADLIGFHTYDYARHFVSACTRILGLEGTPAGRMLLSCVCVCARARVGGPSICTVVAHIPLPRAGRPPPGPPHHPPPHPVLTLSTPPPPRHPAPPPAPPARQAWRTTAA